MRVKMTSTVANAERNLAAGSIHDLPESQAQKYVDAHWAQELDSKGKPIPHRETATRDSSKNERAVMAKPSLK